MEPDPPSKLYPYPWQPLGPLLKIKLLAGYTYIYISLYISVKECTGGTAQWVFYIKSHEKLKGSSIQGMFGKASKMCREYRHLSQWNSWSQVRCSPPPPLSGPPSTEVPKNIPKQRPRAFNAWVVFFRIFRWVIDWEEKTKVTHMLEMEYFYLHEWLQFMVNVR